MERLLPGDDMSLTNVDNIIKDFWENRAVGVVTKPLDFINTAILQYLRERYPYLQMISMQAKFEEAIIPQFKKSSCGWVIHDYGQAMSSSLGKYLYGPRNPGMKEKEEDTTGGSGTWDGTGAGTLIRQTVDTAKAMIDLAIEKGWPGVEIISGTELMQWAAWLAAQEKNYPLIGYSPSREEQKKYDRIRKEKSQTAEESAKLTQKGGI